MAETDIFLFLSGGVIGGFIGAFLSGFAKFIWEYWLPGRLTWQRQQKIDRERFLSKFRDPAMRAITDLEHRIFTMLCTHNIRYVIETGNEDYYILSISFLLANFFAWTEILRRKACNLDYSHLMTRLDEVASAFADGGPGFQIFRLEQREIGERMIRPSHAENEDYSILGYSEFIDLMKGSAVPPCLKRLEENAKACMLNTPIERLIWIQNALIDLVEFIDPDADWMPKDKRKKITLEQVCAIGEKVEGCIS